MKPLIAVIALTVVAPGARSAEMSAYRASGPASLLMSVCGRPHGWGKLLERLGWARGPLLASLIEKGMTEDEVDRVLSPHPGVLSGSMTTGVISFHSWSVYDLREVPWRPWLTVRSRWGPEGGMRVDAVHLRGPDPQGPVGAER